MADRSEVPGTSSPDAPADASVPTGTPVPPGPVSPTSGPPAAPVPPHRTVLARLDADTDAVVVTGTDDEARAALVRGLAEDGRRVRVVAPTAAEAQAWRRRLGEEPARSHRVAPGIVGTVEEIAEHLAATREQDGWLIDLLGPDDTLDAPTATGPVPPLAAGDLATLRRLLVAEHGEPGSGARPRLDPARRHQVLPPPAELPPEPHVDQLAGELLDVAGPAGSPGREAARPLIAALACLPPDAAVALEPAVRRVDETVMALGRGGEDAPWARRVIDAVLDGSAVAAWARFTAALAVVDGVAEHDRLAGSAQVRVTDDTIDLEAAAVAFERFAAFLAGGGSVRRMFKSDEQRAVEAALPGLAVNRVEPTTLEGATAVAHHLRLRQAEATVAAAAAPLGRVLRPAEQRALLVHRLLSLRELGARAAADLEDVDRLRGLLVALPVDVRPPTEGLPAVGRVVATARRLAARSSADLARRELGDVVARLSSGSLPSEQAPELRAAVAALRRLDVAGYAAAVEAVDAARDEQRDLRRSDTLAARLIEWPGLLEALDADTSDATWEPRERRWSQAWAHRRAAAWLPHAELPDPLVTTRTLQPRAGEADLVVVPLDEGAEVDARVVALPGPDDGRRLLVRRAGP
ncbi:hypothetical protein [Actinomycetospora atypica]|uniref:Uncharacterized protein n=1 Tax=Actinomycetospora atypica TaxID=1290095 RepID=A0ABV9YGY6_9PSEU